MALLTGSGVAMAITGEQVTNWNGLVRRIAEELPEAAGCVLQGDVRGDLL